MAVPMRPVLGWCLVVVPKQASRKRLPCLDYKIPKLRNEMVLRGM